MRKHSIQRHSLIVFNINTGYVTVMLNFSYLSAFVYPLSQITYVILQFKVPVQDEF